MVRGILPYPLPIVSPASFLRSRFNHQSMEKVASIALIVHIICGFAALVTGLIAILAKKKRGLHSRVGLIYFISMSGVFLSATLLSILHDIPFLLGVAIFSYYLCLMGFSAARWKGKSPLWLRIVIPSAGTAGAVILFFQGNIVPYVFGGILLLNTLLDFAVLTGLRKAPGGKLAWMYAHAGRMGGSYIATVTAFVVVNLQFAPAPWLPWLLPTVVGSALIIRWNVRMSRKMKKAESVKVAPTQRQDGL